MGQRAAVPATTEECVDTSELLLPFGEQKAAVHPVFIYLVETYMYRDSPFNEVSTSRRYCLDRLFP